MRLEHVSKFKYLRFVWDESSTYGAECRKKVASKKKVAGTIISLRNAMSLQLEFAKVQDEGFIVPILIYGSETMVGRGKEKY